MPLNKQYCFKHSDSEDIYLFTLSNAAGTEVMITNYGAIITSFSIKNQEDLTNDIVLGFNKVEDYFSEDYLQQYPWFGCAVGRYANRIKNAEFSIDGRKYTLTRNRGNDQLHGGANGFDKKVWRMVSSGKLPHAFLELGYRSPDGEEGYPGNLDVVIQYELNNENELSYQYTATCDQSTAINLTHHSYFNLNNGQGAIHDHEIKIYASNMLEQDENLTPTGNIVPVSGTVFDFRNFQRPGDGLDQIPEYDKGFIIDNKNGNKTITLVAEARLTQTKTHLQIYSTEPFVQFYSGKWIAVMKGKNGIMYGPFSGFCLETHKHVNAVNIPHFPDTILRPGEIYKQKTVYKVIHI